MINYKNERIQNKIKEELGDEILDALANKSVLEIIVNPDATLWVDTFEGMKKVKKLDQGKVNNLIKTIGSIAGEPVNKDNPEISAELKLLVNEEYRLYRFEGIISPITSGPTITIRKPSEVIKTMSDYEDDQIMTTDQGEKLRKMIEEKKSILVVGATGSGKTTFCNALLDHMAKKAKNERVIILQDTIELQCSLENKVELKTSENADMSKLLKYTMRLRPDRIIVGEVRGKEANALIKAWNTGHPGGVSTIHANSAQKGLMRIEQLIEEGGVTPVPSAIAEAINIVVFIKKHSNKAGRIVSEIFIVKSYDKVAGKYQFEEI